MSNQGVCGRFATLLTLAWAAVCFATPAHAQVVATHPSAQLTMADLEADITRIPEAQRKSALSNAEAVKANATNLLMRRVLAHEAVKQGMDKDPVVQAMLKIAHDRVLSELLMLRVDQANLPSQKDIEAYAQTAYKANPQRFDQPEQIRARHILIRIGPANARQTAEEILNQIKGGASFEELAKAKSQDPGSAKQGGDLGYFPKGRMVPSFEQAAFALQKPGELSPLIESPFGFHIIKLEDRKPAGPAPYEDVKETLLREAQGTLAAAGRVRERDRIVKDVKLDEAALDAFVKSQTR